MARELPANLRSLWLGATEGDDSQRSLDEVRIINEMTAQEVETFLATNPVDMGAANQLRREPTHVALAVVERGPLRSCRDASGVIVARIRDAKAGKLGPAPTNARGQQAQSSPPPLPPPQPVDPNASDVDKFLLYNRIDQAGAIALKSEPPEVQRLCMSKGTLLNSTNPSASLVARIRLCKEPGAVALNPPPPPASLAALGDGSVPFMPPPMPPTLSLEDRGDFMAAEAQKAIRKLEQAAVGHPLPQPPVPVLAGENSEESASKRQHTNGSEPIKVIDDKHLQDEALRAIQGLNYAEL